jgi:ankyrin repeat protein
LQIFSEDANFIFTFTKHNITPLMFACIYGDSNVIEILLESVIGSTLNHTDTEGFNALYYATYYGHINVVGLLKVRIIEYAKDKKGTSCLHVAI